MNALRSTNIKDIKDKDRHYHFTFKMYDYDSLSSINNINYHTGYNIFENLSYLYIMRYLEQSEPDFGYLDGCNFFMEACLPMGNNKYHLLVPKTNDKIVYGIDNKQYEFEVVMENTGGGTNLYVVMIDRRLSRNKKLKKLKENICQ